MPGLEQRSSLSSLTAHQSPSAEPSGRTRSVPKLWDRDAARYRNGSMQHYATRSSPALRTAYASKLEATAPRMPRSCHKEDWRCNGQEIFKPPAVKAAISHTIQEVPNVGVFDPGNPVTTPKGYVKGSNKMTYSPEVQASDESKTANGTKKERVMLVRKDGEACGIGMGRCCVFAVRCSGDGESGDADENSQCCTVAGGHSCGVRLAFPLCSAFLGAMLRCCNTCCNGWCADYAQVNTAKNPRGWLE